MVYLTIGRADDCDVVLKDSTISRKHAELFQDEDGNTFLTDLDSANGTFVNGAKIIGSVQLQSTDIVKIGNTVLPWRNYLREGNQVNPPKSPVVGKVQGTVKKEVAPGATGAMVFGIIGCIFGIIGIGIVFCIISLVQLKKVKATVKSDPDKYSISEGFVLSGTICSWFGLGFSIFFLAFLVANANSSPPAKTDYINDYEESVEEIYEEIEEVEPDYSYEEEKSSNCCCHCEGAGYRYNYRGIYGECASCEGTGKDIFSVTGSCWCK